MLLIVCLLGSITASASDFKGSGIYFESGGICFYFDPISSADETAEVSNIRYKELLLSDKTHNGIKVVPETL